MVIEMSETQTIYRYICNDGILRERCERHMPRSGSQRIAPRHLLATLKGVRVDACYMCHWEKHRVVGIDVSNRDVEVKGVAL